MHEVLITIATYTSAADAYLTKGLLESAGVTCFLFDENMNFFYSNAVGGVKLKVPSSQLILAKEILGESEKSPSSGANEQDYRCPRCESTNVVFQKLPRPVTIFSSILIAFPIPYLKKKLKCIDCGYTWRRRKTD